MPEEKAISKVTLNGVVLMDVTQDTVAAYNLLSTYTATGADGKPVTGGYPDLFIEALDLSANTYIRNGMTITVGQDNAITLQGTPTALVSFNLVTNLTLPANTDCVVSYDTKQETGVRIYVHAQDSSGIWRYNLASAAPIATFNTGSYVSFAVGLEIGTTFGGSAIFTASLKHPPVPTGTTSITQNGTVDVTQYASAEVNVPQPEPEGVKYIWTEDDGEGAWDVGGYKYCAVDGAPMMDDVTRVWIDLKDSDSLTFTMVFRYAADTTVGSRVINWGDGSEETFTSGTSHTHTYSQTGKYIASVTSQTNTKTTFGSSAFNQSSDSSMRNKVVFIDFEGSNKIANNARFAALYSVKRIAFGPNAGFDNGSTQASTFLDCYSLEKIINFPSNVNTILSSTFRNCRSLTQEMEFPDTMTNIGSYAFNGAYSTTNKLTITIHATTPPTLGTSVFTEANLNKIYVPASSVEDYKAATNWSSYASYIEAIPS